ncbi:uncharacterized protein LOC119374115 [Rhipicephalus sanguineus]|uniref:uncharacterized protein LOC119374115 n=1 Tax=Rhipicephalus sanguineus TaxID=34632 RepID=UPI0018949C7B|nr:uncharacterized protein LOC119374115 [Rhipicephalus sanguineus]
MRQRLKKGVLPSRKIPVRAHDVPAKARKTSRSYATGDRGSTDLETVTPSEGHEQCLCATSSDQDKPGDCEPSLDEWITSSSSCAASHSPHVEASSEHTAAEALLLLQELGMASKSDKATQVNTQHECLTKFRISELIVTDAQLNTFTGIPTHQLFDSIVTIVERYENEKKWKLQWQTGFCWCSSC